MKYLDNLPELELLSQALSFSSPTLKVTTRIEAFSCKTISRERKLYKTLEQDLLSDIELSASFSPPDHEHQINSVFGPLDKPQNRKTLYQLIGTLNLAFPDYDFSSLTADAFTREPSASTVLASLSSALTHLRSTAPTPSTGLYRSFSSYSAGGPPGMSTSPPPSSSTPSIQPTQDMHTHPFLKQVLDPIIDLAECEVYSYAPDAESDPHAAESDFGSVAPSEVDDVESMTSRDDASGDGLMWQMDGVPSSAPSTPSMARRLRSGNYYLTSPLPGRGRSTSLHRRALTCSRSRSQTPVMGMDDASGSGLLWSCIYFLYNKSRKRILFISHHMRRTVPNSSLGPDVENLPINLNAELARRRSSYSQGESLKRRSSTTSLASSRLEQQPMFKRMHVES